MSEGIRKIAARHVSEIEQPPQTDTLMYIAHVFLYSRFRTRRRRPNVEPVSRDLQMKYRRDSAWRTLMLEMHTNFQECPTLCLAFEGIDLSYKNYIKISLAPLKLVRITEKSKCAQRKRKRKRGRERERENVKIAAHIRLSLSVLWWRRPFLTGSRSNIAAIIHLFRGHRFLHA